MDLNNYLKTELTTSIKVKQSFVDANSATILEVAKIFASAGKKRNTIFYFGNGGSATDAMHLAAEHVNKLRIVRPALPSIALTADSAVLTCIANDIDFSSIFSRQLEALGKSDDIAVGISTSGNSANVIKALAVAKSMGLKTIAFTGGDGGKILNQKLADYIFNVSESKVSSRIQETHIFLGHILIEMMDQLL